MDLSFVTISQVRELLEQKKTSATELVQHYLDRIKKQDSDLHAYMTVDEKGAFEDARKSDDRRARGEAGALEGIPGALKDIILKKGVRSTASSKMLEHFIPPYDAFVTKLLEESGAIIVGKTNLDEFAMGASTEQSAYFVSKNPWGKEYVPGGSSGGSAVAVAADEALFALGSDTGGSIRQPAGWTSTVGMKPTYGRVSRNGVMAMASSLDQVGTFTRSVADAALLLEVLGKHDPLDSTSVNKPSIPYTQSLQKDLKGVRVGVVDQFMSDGVDESIKKATAESIAVLEKLGATIKHVSMPLSTEKAVAIYQILVPGEVSTNLERFDGIKYGYSSTREQAEHSLAEVYLHSRGIGLGAEAKRRSMLGAFVLSAGYFDAYYTKAQKVRALLKQEFDQAFQDVDVLVGPVSPTMPFKIGQNVDDPLAMYLADIFMDPVNLAGLPAISVPAGFEQGLPIGFHIIANQWQEEQMFRVAYAYEQATEWHTKHPKEA